MMRRRWRDRYPRRIARTRGFSASSCWITEAHSLRTTRQLLPARHRLQANRNRRSGARRRGRGEGPIISSGCTGNDEKVTFMPESEAARTRRLPRHVLVVGRPRLCQRRRQTRDRPPAFSARARRRADRSSVFHEGPDQSNVNIPATDRSAFLLIFLKFLDGSAI